MIPQLDLTRQHAALRDELLAAAARVLASSRFILGPEGQALEAELAALSGARHGVGLNSGTDALLLALKAVGVGPGDEVITSAFSFVASASTVVMTGAAPVFVDIDPETYNLDGRRIEAAVTPRTRAILPVHLYGQPAAMDEIEAIARRHGLAVVADAAQAVGAEYGGRPIGAWGDASTLSFYPTKNLGACGDGGMVLTTRDDVAERVRRLRDHGSTRKYVHVELGYSSRLDELQAALLRVKLARPARRVDGGAPAHRRPVPRGTRGRRPRAPGRARAGAARVPPVRRADAEARRDGGEARRARRRHVDSLPGDPAVPADVRSARRGARLPARGAGGLRDARAAVLPGDEGRGDRHRRERGAAGGGGGRLKIAAGYGHRH
jgi:hypothetical protein